MISKETHSDELSIAIDTVQTEGPLLRDEFNRPGGPRGTTHHAEADERAEKLILERLA